MWIKAKYVERKFVRDLSALAKASSASQRSSRSSSTDINVRKWSVRKLRRRPRSVDNNKKRKNERRARSSGTSRAAKAPASASVESQAAVPDEFIEKANLETDTEKHSPPIVKTDVLLFGSDLDKQPLSGSIDLSSDQDSTGGEDNETIGMHFHLFH